MRRLTMLLMAGVLLAGCHNKPSPRSSSEISGVGGDPAFGLHEKATPVSIATSDQSQNATGHDAHPLPALTDESKQDTACPVDEKSRTVGFHCDGVERQQKVNEYLVAHPCVEFTHESPFSNDAGAFYITKAPTNAVCKIKK